MRFVRPGDVVSCFHLTLTPALGGTRGYSLHVTTIQYPSRARMRNDQMLAYEGIREAAMDTTVRFGGYGSDP